MMKFLAIMMSFFILGCTRNDERLSIDAVVNVQRIELTQDEIRWIKNNPPIRWAAEKNRPPYIWHDYSTAYGLSQDYINIIAQKTGLVFTPVFTDTLNDSIDAIKAKKVDIITAVRPTPARSEYLRFSPVYSFSSMVLVFNSKKTNAPLKMGVVEGAAANDYVKARFPKIEIIAYPHDSASIKALGDGVIDTAIMDFYTYDYFSKILKLDFITTLIDFDYTTSMAYRADAHILGSIITKAVASVTLEERTRIIKRWVK